MNDEGKERGSGGRAGVARTFGCPASETKRPVAPSSASIEPVPIS